MPSRRNTLCEPGNNNGSYKTAAKHQTGGNIRETDSKLLLQKRPLQKRPAINEAQQTVQSAEKHQLAASSNEFKDS